MLITFLATILLFIIFLINIKISKNLISPASAFSLLYLLVFLFFIIFALITKSTYWLDYHSLYFPIGCIVFSFGFHISIYVLKKLSNVSVDKVSTISLSTFAKIVIVISFVLSFYYIAHYTFTSWTYISGSIINFFNVNKTIGFNAPFVFFHHRTFSLALYYIACYIIFFKKYEKKDLFFYFLIIISAIFHLIMNGSRTQLFKVIIPAMFIFLFGKNYNQKKLFLISLYCMLLVVFLTALLTFFMGQPVSIDHLRLYLNSGVVAFSDWLKHPVQDFRGIYTFRFVFAILSKLGLYKGIVPFVEMSYPKIEGIDWLVGNVYTFYHGYARDFGPIYALFIQFIVSCIHGILYYKSYTTKEMFWYLLHGISYFPLIMQFFTDNYFVLLSFWIQIFIVVFIFSKTKLFIELKYD